MSETHPPSEGYIVMVEVETFVSIAFYAFCATTYFSVLLLSSKYRGPSCFWRSEVINVVKPTSDALVESNSQQQSEVVSHSPKAINYRWAEVILHTAPINAIQTIRGAITGATMYGVISLQIIFLTTYFEGKDSESNIVVVLMVCVSLMATIFLIQMLRMTYHLNYLVMVLPRREKTKEEIESEALGLEVSVAEHTAKELQAQANESKRRIEEIRSAATGVRNRETVAPDEASRDEVPSINETETVPVASATTSAQRKPVGDELSTELNDVLSATTTVTRQSQAPLHHPECVLCSPLRRASTPPPFLQRQLSTTLNRKGTLREVFESQQACPSIVPEEVDYDRSTVDSNEGRNSMPLPEADVEMVAVEVPSGSPRKRSISLCDKRVAFGTEDIVYAPSSGDVDKRPFLDFKKRLASLLPAVHLRSLSVGRRTPDGRRHREGHVHAELGRMALVSMMVAPNSSNPQKTVEVMAAAVGLKPSQSADGTLDLSGRSPSVSSVARELPSVGVTPAGGGVQNNSFEAQHAAMLIAHLALEEKLSFRQHEVRLGEILRLMGINYAVGTRLLVMLIPLVFGMFHQVALAVATVVTIAVLVYMDCNC